MIGLPYHETNSISIGIATKTTQIGLQLPIETVRYPTYSYNDSNNIIDINSALGGYAKSKISILSSSFGFNKSPKKISDLGNKNLSSNNKRKSARCWI